MNSIPPSWDTAIFNTSAFVGQVYLTKQDADRLYLPISAGRNLDLIDSISPGIVSPSKAVIVDSSNSIIGFNNIGANSLTMTSLTSTITLNSTLSNSITTAGGISVGGVLFGSTQASYLTSITPGIGQANKALILNASANISSINSLTANTLNTTTLNTTTISITSTTASISLTTGALTLVGGIGINNSTDATSSTNGGTITTAGGIAVAKQIYVGGQSNQTGIVNNGNLLSGDVGGSTGFFRFVNSASICYVQSGTSLSSGSNCDLFFGNMLNTASASSRKLMLKAGGNFGIGTYNPQTACSVNGTLRVCNSSDGTESDYSEFSQQSSGGLQIKLNGSIYQNLRLQQQVATSNLGIATGLDMGTAYQTRCLALTATSGGISGSEHYGFGTTSAQNLENYTYGGFRWITGSTTSTLGTVRMILNQNGALGIGGTPGCALDISAGNLRVQANSAPSTGAGLEFSYSSGVANIYSFDRSAGSYKDINFNDKAYLTSGGRFGIGTSSPQFPLDINGSANNSTLNSFGYLAGSGSGTATGYTNRPFSIRTSSGIWVTGSEIDVLSDIRSKRNIDTIPEEIVNKVLKTVPIKYQYNSQHEDDKRFHLGYRAQDLVKRGLPELVGFVEADEPLGDQDIECDDGSIIHLRNNQRLVVNMHEIIPILHRAIQLQQQQINELKKIINMQ